jgi:putative ABC transport system substrate-binding protein
MAKYRADAVLIHQDGMLNANAGKIAEFARKQKLPSAGFKEFAESGGLIGYGVSFPQMYRRAAAFVDKLLKGAKAGDLPVEQPSTFELVLNLRTAKALGVAIPRSFLARADAAIE